MSKFSLENWFSFKNPDGTSLLNPKKLLIDLLIVFSGVYIAFLLGNYSESQKAKIQQQKIMSSLKNELEYMRIFYPNQKKYQAQKVKEWEAMLDSNKVVEFFAWRYVQPQYNYTVVEYAINSREIGVIDFNLHQQLMKVYQGLKQVEYAEEKMTTLALEYQPIPAMMDSTKQDYQIMFRHNRFLFRRFTVFAGDRAAILGRISSHAKDALSLINDYFAEEDLYAIEKEILVNIFVNFHGQVTENYIRETIKEAFPNMTEEGMQEIIEEVNRIRK